MPKQAVVKFECERCPQVWYAEDDEETVNVELTVSVPGAKARNVKFGVLCPACSAAVVGYVENIVKKLEKTASLRTKKEEAEASSPATLPVSPAADSQRTGADHSTTRA